MKTKLLAVLFAIFLAVVGCSGSSNPQDQLADIDKRLAKGFEMTVPQQQEVNKLVADGKKMIAAGKTEEAGKMLTQAIKVLKFAEEADAYNKSE